MKIYSPTKMSRIALTITFCFDQILNLALCDFPAMSGNCLLALQPKKAEVRQSAGLNLTMSFALAANPRPITQYCLSISTILSYQLSIQFSESAAVTMDPQYYVTTSPLLMDEVANSPIPPLGIDESPTRNLYVYESLKSQYSSRISYYSINYNNLLESMEGSNDVSKQQTEAFFQKEFQDPFNNYCYECGRKTRQWVDVRLAIYLCLNCCALYKQASPQIIIKCITADPWTQEELKFIKNGGNRKMREFLSNYEMQELIYKQRLRTKAVEYYRTMLKEEDSGRAAPMAPDATTGLEIVNQQKVITEMSAQEIMEEVKNRAFFVGNITKEYGSKAYTTVSEKITSGELKEGAVKTAEDIGNKAKGLWEKLVLKVENMTG